MRMIGKDIILHISSYSTTLLCFSRARGLIGLEVLDWRGAAVRCDPAVRQFYAALEVSL